ncbi:SDR family oxidoreductase [Spirosoma sp. 48-14]|jgi:NAD(P)-dependent dehydrogenase (short-subunit alcohol dehydrogenase family)|uniref:SDR family oxidoreductase n=1 Tax=Spirosoma sp. 48-14 TaxID=1895854 RepID=UPI0009641F6C|nr:SDR family oxidoreductase [Spirosoma sp. 48-14]OJW70280.1 MAG: short-chain dehydrogenase/reductase [Spirosoma sp. 48-14]
MSKIILITGASTGLGETIATYLAQKGFTVYGTSRSIEQKSKPFLTMDLDVCNEASIQKGVNRIIEKHGRIDVLINNAGLAIAGPVEALPLAEVQRVFDTNVFGTIRTIQAVLPTMRQQKSGLIINISSIAAEAGLPFRGGYCASKAAVDRLTEALRLELASFGIQACYIQPGGTKTDINKNRLRVSLPANSAYKETFDRTYALIDESVSEGIEPDVFGPLVEKIIQSPQVDRLYRVGKSLEKFSVLLKSILPTGIYERMIRNHYKM